MNKRITSILLCIVMIVSMLVTAVPVFAVEGKSTSFKLTADKTAAEPGDTITFTVTMGAVEELAGLGLDLRIPSGLTFVSGSGKVTDGLMATMSAANIMFTESSKIFMVAACNYTSTGNTALMTFQCKVDDGTSGSKTVKLGLVDDDPDNCCDLDYDNFEVNFTPVTITVTTPHTHVYDQTSTDITHRKTGATCTEAAVYYKSCECGANGTETFTSGDPLGHDYTKKTETNAYLKTAASKCTEHNVYWYACSRCDASAKDDAAATDKYYTGTATGAHSFTEKIENEAHYVAGAGTNCQSAKKYYYDCAYCNQMGTTAWESTTYGPHSYATTWSSDEDGHWHECSVCHDKADEAEHTPDRAAATETEPVKCTVCDYVITPALGHTHSLSSVAANPATCLEDGNEAYYVCSGCGKWYEDAMGSVEIVNHDDVVIDALGHDWADATCTDPKTCKREGCGATEGVALGHTEGTVWEKDEDYHWHICTVDGCGAIIETSKALHTPDHEGHATEDYAIKCEICDYVIEEQLEPNTPVTNIAATIDAPVIGETPDYAPVCVSTPEGGAEIYDLSWFKIAADDFTGTSDDDWDEMDPDEEFTTGYYYAVDIYLFANEGYEFSEDITGTVNGKAHDNTYGDVYDDEYEAYLSGFFEPLAAEYTIDLPVSLAVKLTGDEKPAKETFKFEIYDLGCEDAEFEIVNNSVVVENLEFDENGVAFAEGIIKIKVTGEDQLFNLTEGFNVRMVKGTAKGWTYASEKWNVTPIIDDGTTTAEPHIGYDVRQIVDGEISEDSANCMSYTVSYKSVAENGNNPHSPGTGDNRMIELCIALLALSGLGLAGTTIYSRKKKYSAK